MGSGAHHAAAGVALIILGWDPGVKFLGYGVLALEATRSRCLAHGVLGTGMDDASPAERLDALATGIDGLMNTWTPDVTGYEDQTGVNIAMERAGKSNAFSRRIHEVTGMIRMGARCSLAEPVPVYSHQPRVIKIALLGKGHGNATKDEIKWGVDRLFGVKTNQHAADAIACAVASARSHRVAMATRRRAG